MAESLYDVISAWTKQDWKIELYFDIVNEVSSQVNLAGHLETPLGKEMISLWKWFDEMLGGMGLIMSDQEQQTELRDKLEKGSMKLLQDIKVTIKTTPDLTVLVTNIDELKKTGDPEALDKAKKGFDTFFSGLTYGGEK